MLRRICGVFPAAVLVSAWPSWSAAAQDVSRYDVTLGADYRFAQLDWNIAGDLSGNNPNVLSELAWHDLEIAQISAAVHARLGEHVVVQAGGAYGKIVNGKNQDSDYAGDNRTAEFSRSNNDGAGHIWDASLGLGYRFRVYDPAARHYAVVTPMAGYSLHRQELQAKNGVQTVPALGPIPGLDSSYDAEWKGPWLGVNLHLAATEHTAFIFNLAYHWADYTAQANWNLRTDMAHPLSFRHDTRGTGIVTALGVTHALSRHWEVVARLESQHWTGDPGTDTTYAIDSNTRQVQVATSRLNTVHWRSRAAGFAATYHF